MHPQTWWLHSWHVWSVLLVVAVGITAIMATGVSPAADIRLSQELQNLRTPVAEPFSQALYWSGMNPYFSAIGLMVAGGLVVKRDLIAAALVTVALSSRGFATVIKELVERQRPDETQIALIEGANGYSFPSGHALGTFLLVGAIWWALMQYTHDPVKRRLLTVTAFGLILLMGVQRVYAGAHWTTDVIGAYLWGWVLLFLLIQLHRRLSAMAPQSYPAASPDFSAPSHSTTVR